MTTSISSTHPSNASNGGFRIPSRASGIGMTVLFLLGVAFLSSSIQLPMTKSSENQRRLSLLTTSDYDGTDSLKLFTVSDYTVLGPTRFPKPSAFAGPLAKPGLEPKYGQHRPSVDAVFAFAAEYDLHIYQCFIETLRETGFEGDVVLAVAKQDLEKLSVSDYLLKLQSEQGLNVVIYVVELSCFNAEMESVSSAKGGMRVCQIHGMYSNDAKLMQDPRPARTLQTTRYELYWMWSLRYNPHSWIMLVDARDTYFQTNPFAHLPRETENPNRSSGELHFFGENTDATRIGQSPKNRKWITNAYGDEVIAAMQHKPTICSGSTMGEQIALETYLRAMVSESDETLVKLMGADQGFHNYLYYSNKLANADTIRSITVFGQGLGAMNNLGAMRTKPLEEWGNGKLFHKVSDKEMVVYNWDGTLSPVVHQFDRHKELSGYVYKHKAKLFQKKWQTKQ